MADPPLPAWVRLNGKLEKRAKEFQDGPPDVPFEIYKLHGIGRLGITGGDWNFLRSLPNLRYAFFSNERFDDDVLSRLVGHPNLTNIHLTFTSVSDDGVRHLATMERLRVVSMACRPTGNQPRLTDAGVAHLARVTQLQQLQLKYSVISDDGLARLTAACPSLTVLALDQCKGITDAGVDHLKSLPELNQLNLTGASLAAAAAAQSLGSLSQLTSLTLVQTEIGDETLKSLSGLPQLRHLDLQKTKITDDGLKHLSRLKLDSLMLGHELPQYWWARGDGCVEQGIWVMRRPVEDLPSSEPVVGHSSVL
jgi:hypothetical protein